MTSPTGNGRILWIRSEAFDHGVFNTSVRWTVPKVLDFLGSLRVAAAYSNVSRETWVDASTTRCKPALTESEAAAYWSVFRVLQQDIVGQSGDWLDIRVIGLILMCQVFSPHRVRTDHKAALAESWPSHERREVSSPRHSPRSSSPRVAAVSAQTAVNRGRDASAALAFVRQHFGYFLQIACYALSAEPAIVNAEDFNVLGLILCAGNSFSQPLKRLSEAIPELVSKKSLPTKELRKIVEKSLVWNDEIYSSSDQGLTVQAIPEGNPGRTVNIAGLAKTTWLQRSPITEIDFLNITSCNDCTIYVTSSCKYCLIAGCHECTIIMGAVSTMCTLQSCEKVSVHVASHCFKMENSIDSSAYLFCHVNPILTGDTRGIKLAPFNVLYSELNSMLAEARMKLEPEYVDVWAHPVCCTLGSPDETLSGRAGSLDEPNHSTYHFVHPNNFQPVVVPEAGARTPSSAAMLCLPQTYDEALKSRQQEMLSFHSMLSEITDEGKRKRAQQAIQGHFREWLQTTGKSRQLADLARMADSGAVMS